MRMHISALAALLMSGCAAAHGDFETMCDGPLHATVTIEETGETFPVDFAGTSGSFTGRSDGLMLRLEHEEWLNLTFRRPAALGVEHHFMNEPSIPSEARVFLSRDLVHLCSTSEMSEGELILDYVRIGPDDFVDCAIGSLRVRFADCDAEVFGRSAAETTFLVEIGR